MRWGGLLRILLPACLALACLGAGAVATDVRQFDSAEQQQRYARLLGQLRCLVCQNQALADSNAGLAADMRAIVGDMVRANASDEQIIGFMVERYGDFVRYRPPFNAATALLWGGPFIIAAAALGYVVLLVRRQRPAALSGDDEQAARRLLDE